MSIHFRRELERLRTTILEQCADVERAVADAARAFLERDPERAALVIGGGGPVNGRAREIEDDCLGLLALYQPVAGDLRFIFTAAHISSRLERIGGLAENLAKKARSFAPKPALALPPEFAEMAGITCGMLTECVEAFIRQDVGRARAVIARDDEVDIRKRRVRQYAESAIMAAPGEAPRWISVIAAARNLERVADHSALISGEVVYAVEGRVERHEADAES